MQGMMQQGMMQQQGMQQMMQEMMQQPLSCKDNSREHSGSIFISPVWFLKTAQSGAAEPSSLKMGSCSEGAFLFLDVCTHLDPGNTPWSHGHFWRCWSDLGWNPSPETRRSFSINKTIPGSPFEAAPGVYSGSTSKCSWKTPLIFWHFISQH